LRDDGNLLQDLLVGVEVQGYPRVVPLNHLARGLLHSLGTYTTHFREVAVPASRQAMIEDTITSSLFGQEQTKNKTLGEKQR
jgi:hypothetical protein